MRFYIQASALDTLVKERRSIRGYKKKPVPQELIAEIIAVAKGAPSSMNTQPWFLHVVTGEPLDRIREGKATKISSRIPGLNNV
jgi:nitroreductase